MDDINELKEMWSKLNSRLTAVEEENLRLATEIRLRRKGSALEKLKAKYRAFIIIEIMMLGVVYFEVLENPMFSPEYRVPVFIYWILFFLMAIGFDLILLFRLRKIDLYRQSISEVARRAAGNWRIHKIMICIALPLAIGAIVLFVAGIGADKYFLWGVALGAIAGLVIGLRQLYIFNRYYKDLEL